MAHEPDAPAEPIIIVRRRGEEDEHHHGGVWKIAYADFMTAMMAFFLVMWLINAANTETKASVASYFNPIRLTDSVARKKGLFDLDEKANSVGAAKKKDDGAEHPAGQDNKDKTQKQSGASPGIDDTGEHQDGQAVKMDKRGPISGAGLSETAGAAEPGRAFRSPFSPFGSPPQPSVERDRQTIEPNPKATQDAENGQTTVAAKPPQPQPQLQSQSQSSAPSGGAEASQGQAAAKLTAEAEQVMKSAQAALKQLGTTGGPAIDVTIEGNNIVMSLTDTASFGMFAVGSAEPNELLVKLMQSLTSTLTAHGDRIILRGHTDSRPYRSDARNNNWRLAMARAEAAYAILLRSGIDEARFERIEAHADRKPKIATDTEAAANRRIEIIMRRSEK